MWDNRPYSSEGGESESLPTPISNSLPFQGGPSTRIPLVSRQAHEREVGSMDEYESLSHTKWSANITSFLFQSDDGRFFYVELRNILGRCSAGLRYSGRVGLKRAT
jgi:hypothetical protein